MEVKMKVSGLESVLAQLRYTAQKVPEVGRKTMHKIADKIVKEAQLNAPVDKHFLEKSIHKEVSYEDRGRLAIDIVMGGIVEGVDVDQYAVEIHENYEHMIPGQGTLNKMAQNPGRHIGSKFLDRAIETVGKNAPEEILKAVLMETEK